MDRLYLIYPWSFDIPNIWWERLSGKNILEDFVHIKCDSLPELIHLLIISGKSDKTKHVFVKGAFQHQFSPQATD